MSTMGSIPDPVEMQDFQMKQLCKFRVTDQQFDLKDTVSLVCTSHLFGLVFVGTPDKVLVIQISNLVEIDNGSSKKTEISSFPSKSILLPSKPFFITLSSDNLTLMVCLKKSGCPFGWLYDVRGYARQTGEWNPFQEIRLSSTEGVTVTDCAWNPTTPGLVAISLSDGSLLAVEINNTQFTINSLPSNTGAGVLSWSPKGKQLVVARPGKLVQYKPDLKEAKTITFTGNDLQMGEPTVCGLQWLSTSQFLVTFIDQSDPNGRPHLCICNVQKSGTSFIDYDDVCYGNSSERPSRYFSLSVSSWNVLLACSANAMEVAVLGQSASASSDNPEWRQWMLEGESRAELPLDENEETKPLGMAIDITSQIPIPWDDNQTIPPAPILFVLSTHGLLCPFHVLNHLKGTVPVNHPPQALTAANERPALTTTSLKSTHTIPLAASTPIPSASKNAIPRTNLGERFAAVGGTIAPTTVKSMPTVASAESFFSSKPAVQQITVSAASQQVPPKSVQTSASATSTLKPVDIAPSAPFKKQTEVIDTSYHKPAPILSLPTPEHRPIVDDSSLGAANAILCEEVAKFAQELAEFKARSCGTKFRVASEEDKEKLLKMTTDLTDFGKSLVETTKTQDEKVRGLCTDLVEVTALMEDARVRHARRKNSRYSHLLKLRPLDPANRRKLDSIERLHVHIEQQLVEASRHLDSFSRHHSRGQQRKIEIPVTQVICEAIKNNAKVISQLKLRVERMKAQSKEQQLKLAGAAFEALRPTSTDESHKWDSELAVLADSLLSSRIRGEGDAIPSQSVIPQVSPEKQAMLRNVLAHRPVARIRAVRPESVAESRLLSNFSGIIHADDKKDSSMTSVPITSVPQQPQSKTNLFQLGSNSFQSSPETKLPVSSFGATKINSNAFQTFSPTQALSKPALQQLTEVEDITPPSSPRSLEQKAKIASSQPMISSLSLSTLSATPDSQLKAQSAETKSSGLLLTSLGPRHESKSMHPSSTTSKTPFGASVPDSQSVFIPTIATSKPLATSSFSVTPCTTISALSKTAITGVSSFPSFGTNSVATCTASTMFLAPASSSVDSKISSSAIVSSAALPSSVTKSTEAVTSSNQSFSFASLSSAPVIAPPPYVLSTTQSTAGSSLASFSFSSKASTQLATSSAAATPISSSFPVLSQPSSLASNSASASQASLAKPTSSSTFSFALPKDATTSNNAPKPTSFSFSLPSTSGTSATPPPFGATISPAPAAQMFSLNTKTSNVFGQAPATTSASVFGQAPATTSAPVFGQAPATTSASVFGQASATTSTSVFGQAPATTSTSVFGQTLTTSTASTPTFSSSSSTITSMLGHQTSGVSTIVSSASLTSLFSQSKLASSVPTAATTIQPTLGQVTSPISSTASISSTIPTTVSLFGRPVTTVGSTVGTGSLFGKSPNSVAPFSSSSLGQNASQSAAPTPTVNPVFGQTSFGSTPQTSAAAQPTPSFGSAPVFGQTLGASSGMLTGSVFGQSATSANTVAKPLFGGSSFPQSQTSSPTGLTPQTSSSGLFSGSNTFGNMGLGGTPNAANTNRNVFGGGAVFGSAASSGQATFGATSASSPFGGQTNAATTAATFGSPTTGFGAFGQGQSSFGGAPTFGGSPLFGGKPSFGGSATFGNSPSFGGNATFGGGASFGSPVLNVGSPKPEGGFGAFAATSNVPTFGVLASSAGPSFESLASSGNSQPAFGGASFPSSGASSFGGGSSFSSWR